MFDEKPSGRDEYTYSGKAGTGITCEGNVERHSTSRAIVMMNIPKWAEEQGLNNIRSESFADAVSMKLAEEQHMIMNGRLWGVRSAAVIGSAGTLFKGAGALLCSSKNGASCS